VTINPSPRFRDHNDAIIHEIESRAARSQRRTFVVSSVNEPSEGRQSDHVAIDVALTYDLTKALGCRNVGSNGLSSVLPGLGQRRSIEDCIGKLSNARVHAGAGAGKILHGNKVLLLKRGFVVGS
jgi:hypothetical protein